MEDQEKDKEFWEYVELGNNMPPQSADNMLIAYSFFKQGTVGDNTHERPTESSNVVETFKHDAWKRLEGMPQQEAKQKYIEVIKELLAELKEADKSKAPS